jgi:hypothetical protein
MSWRGFAPGLVFAAVASAALLPLGLLLSPLLGWPHAHAHALLVTGVVAVYTAGLANGASRRVGSFAAVVLLGLGLQLAGAQLGELAVALTAALAVCRSAVFFRVRPARAAAVEGVLGLAALGMAGFLYGPSALGLALAVWGYLLVQSAWFLVPGARRRADCVPQLDAFEEAERRARGLLEGA